VIARGSASVALKWVSCSGRFPKNVEKFTPLTKVSQPEEDQLLCSITQSKGWFMALHDSKEKNEKRLDNEVGNEVLEAENRGNPIMPRSKRNRHQTAHL